MTRSEFIRVRLELLERLDARAAKLAEASLEHLNRPFPGHWSALGCVDHLNLAGRGYLPRMADALGKAPALDGDPEVKFGFIAQKLYDMVGPDAGDNVPVPPAAEPSKDPLGLETIEEFRGQLGEMRRQLEDLRTKDGRAILRSPLNRMIKLSVYEALAIMLHHADRHVGQAERKLSSL